MSHRKFEHPRCGSLGFLPKKRNRRGYCKIRHFPKDEASKPCHLTAFVGFKSGMTHVVRSLGKPGSKAHKKEICESVTVIEAPPMIVFGIVGYVKTPRGVRTLNTVFTDRISQEVQRCFYKNWFAKKDPSAFANYTRKHYNHRNGNIEDELQEMKTYCCTIRALCQTQVHKVRGIKRKKAHIKEIQVNGGSIDEKIDFLFNIFNKAVHIHNVFEVNEMIDVISVTKGEGTNGVISRWGVTRLPRKTHRGSRKVACIGAWHPSAVKWTVARAGQKGFHNRTEINKKIIASVMRVIDRILLELITTSRIKQSRQWEASPITVWSQMTIFF